MLSALALRWWSRLIRKQLLGAAAIGMLLLAVRAPALADDNAPAPRPAVPPDTTALARASIVAGRFDEALRILDKVAIASDRSEDERGTAAELRAVVDRWVALGGTIAVRSAAEPAPLPGTDTADDTAATPDAWESAFAVSRARLVAGNFQDAGPGFSLLLGSARTQHQWQCAYALASLASELVAKNLVLRVGHAAPAAAAAADRTPAAPPRKHSHWYGWQTIIVDGMSLLVVPAMADETKSTSLLALGVGGYALGGPIVHLAHGEVARGAASLGLRVGLPFLGALGGAMVDGNSCSGEICRMDRVVLGGALGVLAAVVVDSAALAYERVQDEPAAAKATPPSPRRSRVALSPLAGPRKNGGFDVGIGGVF